MNKNYKIMFASHPDYSGNAKALYEYMKDRYPNFSLSWVVYEEQNVNILSKNDVDVVFYETNEFKKKFDEVDIVFFTHDELIELKKPNQIYIYLGHGISGKRCGYMLEKKNLPIHDSKYLDLMKNNIDYVICSSELWQLLYNAMLDVERSRILSLGTPRTDYIYDKNSKKKLQKIINVNLKNYKKIIMYLPTFRDGLGRSNDGDYSENIFNMDSYDEKSLDEYLKENGYLLIVKYHPYEQNKVIKYQSDNIVYLFDEVMTDNLISLTEIVGVVDLIVSDYSSAYSDYVILDKPVCFLHNDIVKYVENRGIIFNSLDFWSPGPTIHSFDEMKIEFEKLLKSRKYFSKERKMYVDIMFEKNVSNISKNICDYLFDSDFDLFADKKDIIDDKVLEMHNEILRLKYKLSDLDSENQIIKDENTEMIQRINQLYNSKGWKMLEKVRRVIYKFKK